MRRHSWWIVFMLPCKHRCNFVIGIWPGRGNRHTVSCRMSRDMPAWRVPEWTPARLMPGRAFDQTCHSVCPPKAPAIITMNQNSNITLYQKTYTRNLILCFTQGASKLLAFMSSPGMSPPGISIDCVTTQLRTLCPFYIPAALQSLSASKKVVFKARAYR